MGWQKHQHVYFSQGPGNFRDVNQNRRVDVSVTPYIKDFNIRTFLSLVQLDGYNPLSVTSTLFKMDKSGAKQVMALLEIPKGLDETITNILTAPFRPGNLIQSLYDQGKCYCYCYYYYCNCYYCY
jgi:hypothetical protein